MQTIVETVEQRPYAVLAAFLGLHVAVWTALPTAFYPNLPLDLIEALTYGREWQLGYDKLPPLPWWLVEATRALFGADLLYYALAQLTVVAAFVAVWAMARWLVGAVGALAALLILDGLHYVDFTAVKFNHDVIQLPFWAVAGFCFWAALRRGRLMYWIVLGLTIGLAFWAKYFVLVLAVPLALFLLIDRDARRALATPGPYVTVAVALVVAAPHLLWLIQNDFLPFRYAEARAQPSSGLVDHVWFPVRFAVGQLGFVLPALVIALPLVVPRGEKIAVAADAFDRRIVTLLAFGPAAALIALSFLTGRGIIAMWGYPLWLFLGLWIVLTTGVTLDRARTARIVTVWAVVFCGFALAFAVNYGVMPAYDGRYRAVLFPGERLAAEMSARFRALTGRPLAYVIATMWTGGNIAHYAPERPRVLIDGSPSRAPWIDIGDLRARGAVVVWVEGNPRVLPPPYRAVAEDAELQEPFTLPYRRGPGGVTVGWAVLRPRPVVALTPAP
jgi:4-amino-4-deoxy-L-arabinose transferase-like glycosyltransferase